MSDLGNKEIMAENISYYMEQQGINATQLAEDLDMPYTTLLSWINGKNYPRIDKIEIMANYFGIKKSDLVEKHTAPEEERQDIKILARKAKDLSGAQVEILLKMIDEMKK